MMNAFKVYCCEVIEHLQLLLLYYFNLIVELLLKVIMCGFSYVIVFMLWMNCVVGEFKLVFNEMGSCYLFIVFYVFFEQYFSCGDYWWLKCSVVERLVHVLVREGERVCCFCSCVVLWR